LVLQRPIPLIVPLKPHSPSSLFVTNACLSLVRPHLRRQRAREAGTAPVTWSTTISSLAHTLFWVSLAGYMWWKGNIAYVLFNDQRINTSFLYLGCITAVIVTACFLYFTIVITPQMKGTCPVDASL